LGKGSFGKVMLVEMKETGISFDFSLNFHYKIGLAKVYAMKIISKNMVERRNQIIHTKAERMILENMDNTFIIQLHFAFQTSDKLYLVMDFMIGG